MQAEFRDGGADPGRHQGPEHCRPGGRQPRHRAALHGVRAQRPGRPQPVPAGPRRRDLAQQEPRRGHPQVEGGAHCNENPTYVFLFWE